MRDVVVLGVGSTKYGRLDATVIEMASQASVDAMNDAGIEPKEIEALYLANCQGSFGASQLHMAPVVSSDLSLPNIPTVKVESACATGGIAFRLGYMAVAGGFYDIVMVTGTESVLRMSTSRATEQFAVGSDFLYVASCGATFPGFYAMIARAHMHKYGTTAEQLASVAVKNHKNAMKNPLAQFHREITIEQALNSPMIADPFRLFDCCPFSDGASAVILAPATMAKRVKKPVQIIGSGQNSDYIAVHDRKDPTKLLAAELAANQAYKQAGVTPKDIDLAEVHDCFTVAEIIATEDLGFFKRGEAAAAALEGRTAINGEITVNCSGGLKAKGHPVAATGIGQIYEVVKQLRGETGERQVKNAEIGLAHNVGADGGTATVHILRRL